MILELDFNNKIIEVQSSVKLNELIEKLMELNLNFNEWTIRPTYKISNFPTTNNPWYQLYGYADNIPCTITTNTYELNKFNV